MPRSRKPPSIPTAPAAGEDPDFICFYRPTLSHTLSADAEGGDPAAQFRLGRLYLEGRPERSHTGRNDGEAHIVSFTPEVTQDNAQAVLWLQRAADQGHAEARQLLDSVLAPVKGVH